MSGYGGLESSVKVLKQTDREPPSSPPLLPTPPPPTQASVGKKVVPKAGSPSTKSASFVALVVGPF